VEGGRLVQENYMPPLQSFRVGIYSGLPPRLPNCLPRWSVMTAVADPRFVTPVPPDPQDPDGGPGPAAAALALSAVTAAVALEVSEGGTRCPIPAAYYPVYYVIW
jgi:hypothetical protein